MKIKLTSTFKSQKKKPDSSFAYHSDLQWSEEGQQGQQQQQGDDCVDKQADAVKHHHTMRQSLPSNRWTESSREVIEEDQSLRS